MQRGGAGYRGVEPVAVRRRRIVDQRGANPAPVDARIARATAPLAANGEMNDRMTGSSND
jgi:hypothetical protein